MNATCAPRRARRGAILIRQTQLQTIHPPSNNRNCHTAHNTDNQCSQHWHDVVTYMTSCNIAFCHNTHSAQLSTLRQLWKFRESFQVWQTCQCSTSPQLQTLTWPTHSCPSSITNAWHVSTHIVAISTIWVHWNRQTFMVGCHKVHSHHNHDNRRIDDIMIVNATHIQLIHMEPSEIPSTNNSTVSPNALMHLLLFRATRDHRRVVCGRARARDQPTTHN